MAAAEVLRGKALRLLTEQVPVTDEAGRPVDIKAAAAAMGAEGDGAEEAEEAEEAAGDAGETDEGTEG
jgi:hypothetical protein